MKNKSFTLLLFVYFVAVSGIDVLAQNAITLEDIWQKGTFRAQNAPEIRWAKDENHYYSESFSPSNHQVIVKYRVLSDKAIDTVFSAQWVSEKNFSFEDFAFSPDEGKILLTSESEPIYRHSTRSNFFVYNKRDKSLQKINGEGKAANAEFSPDATKIAFTRDNNLYFYDLISKKEIPVSNDGKINEIINGHTDWVYEEEFSFTKAYFWSPDSKKIAFYRFDENRVPTYSMQTWDGLYPKNYVYKYPKAGEWNAEVSVFIHDLEKSATTKVELGSDTDFYVPRVKWTQNPNLLSVQKMNRLQNLLEVIHVDAYSGKGKTILTEKSQTYIDITDDLTYFPDGKRFLFSSEKNGNNHLYFYDISGALILQITDGNFEVSKLESIDTKNRLIYFTSTEISPLQRQLYVIDFEGKNKKQLTKSDGVHQLSFSPNSRYYIDQFSSASVPPVVQLVKTSTNMPVKILVENNDLIAKNRDYVLGKKSFFSFTTKSGERLNGWKLTPNAFDSTKKHPVLMYVYGGPGHQTVMDKWDGRDFYWYHYLAQLGYVIVSVDGRGTGGRGAAFKKSTYANLGKYELADQVEAANYLSTLSFVDSSRIGIWGWSFGGYLSSLCMTKAAGRFKMGIAVAPVTSWRFYDSIYTERFLKTPQDNAKGYDENSPINYADRLKGNYLLIHGTGDDNVHFQNAVKMQEALIKAGKQFQSFYYPDKNHGIYGGNTRFHLYKMMTDYILGNL